MRLREDELTRLRADAERCYRLARDISDHTAAAILRAMGGEADEEISLLEARQVAPTAAHPA